MKNLFSKKKSALQEQIEKESKFKNGDWVTIDKSEEDLKLMNILIPHMLGVKRVVGIPEVPFKKEIRMKVGKIVDETKDVIIEDEDGNMEVDSKNYRLATEIEINEEKLKRMFK